MHYCNAAFSFEFNKTQKNTEIIRFQWLFIFDDFGMKTNFKSIFHKEQYCRGDHSDSDEFFFLFFIYKFQEIN